MTLSLAQPEPDEETVMLAVNGLVKEMLVMPPFSQGDWKTWGDRERKLWDVLVSLERITRSAMASQPGSMSSDEKLVIVAATAMALSTPPLSNWPFRSLNGFWKLIER